MTVADLLGEDHLRLRVLAPPPSGRLRWVATSELDDPAPFLDGGELLLTTGLHAAGGHRDWAGWLGRLADAGVVAVGFGTGLSHATVPDDLVRAGVEHGVGVLEVPQGTPFIAVTRTVADLLRHGENAADAAAARLERELTRDVTGPGAAQRLLQRLARGLEGSAWLVDGGAAVLRATTPDAFPAEAAALVARMVEDGRSASGSDITRDRTLLVRPLEVGSAPRPYLVVRSGPRFSRTWHGVVGAAAALLGVVVGRERADVGSAARWAGCALDLLLDGQVAAAHEVLGAGGGGAALPPEVRVLRPRAASAADLPVLPPVVVVAVSPRRGDVALLCPDDESVVRTVEDALRGVGVGSLQLASAWGGGALGTWAEAVLAPRGPLVPEDASGLRAAVHAFLLHHGSRQEAAAALGVHRNTLRHRLSRAEDVLGRSLASPRDRAELWLALEAAGAAPTGGGR